MTELQKTLKQLESTLCKIPVAGVNAIYMGDALRLALNARALTAKEQQKEVQDGQGDRD